jgi:hypothetical protein
MAIPKKADSELQLRLPRINRLPCGCVVNLTHRKEVTEQFCRDHAREYLIATR